MESKGRNFRKERKIETQRKVKVSTLPGTAEPNFFLKGGGRTDRKKRKEIAQNPVPSLKGY